MTKRGGAAAPPYQQIMKIEQAIVAVSEHLAVAGTAADRLATLQATGQALDRIQVGVLVRSLQKAHSAAMELDLRAAGTPEPKRGD